jgi:hypothetical protein
LKSALNFEVEFIRKRFQDLGYIKYIFL